MLRNQSPHSELAARMASDEYWAGLVLHPKEDLSAAGRRQYVQDRRHARSECYGVAQEIGAVTISLTGGGTVEPIPEGGEMPHIPSNSRQVIRLVEDVRTITHIASSLYKHVRKSGKLALQSEMNGGASFDELAEQAMHPASLYGDPAERVTPFRFIYLREVMREVRYARRSSRGNFLIGIPSRFGDDPEHLKMIAGNTRPRPVVPIGATYAERYGGISRIARIVRADLVEATSITWAGFPPEPGNDDESDKEREASLLPKLRPGFSSS